MEIKSCGTCEYFYYNNCLYRSCKDCAMASHDGRCKCLGIEDESTCPYYKKYEPTPSTDGISSEE